MNIQSLGDCGWGALVQTEGDKDFSLSPHEVQNLIKEHGLLVIRGHPFSPQQQVNTMSALGRVEEKEGEAYLMRVTNKATGSSAPAGILPFHFDYAYDPNPVPFISLYGEEIEGAGTPTEFAHTKIVDDLPRALYSAIRDRYIVHCCFPEEYAPDFFEQKSTPLATRGAPGWGPEHFWYKHPMILQAGDGTVSIYACELYAHSIDGIPFHESKAILEELFGLLYRRESVYRHQWQANDLVIWNNQQVQHARPEPEPAVAARTLRRYSISDEDITDQYLTVARAAGRMPEM